MNSSDEQLFDVLIVSVDTGIVHSIAAYDVHIETIGQRLGVEDVLISIRVALNPKFTTVVVFRGEVSKGDTIKI